jgi:putative DNA primase/helicase
LKHDGSAKAPVSTPRKTIGALGSGAVRLGAAGTVLGLAEGVETALAVMQLSGVPCWAALGANRLERVFIPPEVSSLEIFGDPDEPGRRAVAKALDRHRVERSAKGRLPPTHSDWNEWLVLERGQC